MAPNPFKLGNLSESGFGIFGGPGLGKRSGGSTEREPPSLGALRLHPNNPPALYLTAPAFHI